MKRLLLFLVLLATTTAAFSQFNDTAALNTYIRENIRDKRPEKVTAEQIQKALLGSSELLRKLTIWNQVSTPQPGGFWVNSQSNTIGTYTVGPNPKLPKGLQINGSTGSDNVWGIVFNNTNPNGVQGIGFSDGTANVGSSMYHYRASDLLSISGGSGGLRLTGWSNPVDIYSGFKAQLVARFSLNDLSSTFYGPAFFGNTLRLGSFSTEPTGANGYMYYNTTWNVGRIYSGGAWRSIITEGTNSYIQGNPAAMQSVGFSISGASYLNNRLWIKSANANNYTANIIIGDGYYNGISIYPNNTEAAGYGHYGQTWTYALNADMRLHPTSSIKQSFGTRIIQKNGNIGGSHFSHYTQMQGGSSGVAGTQRYGYFADVQNDITSAASNHAYGMYIVMNDNYQTHWQYRTNFYGTYIRMPSTQGATSHFAKQGHYINVGNANGNGYAIYADSGLVFIREVPNATANPGQFVVRDGGVIKYLSTAQMKAYLGIAEGSTGTGEITPGSYDFDVAEFRNENNYVSINTINAAKILQTDSLQLINTVERKALNDVAIKNVRSYRFTGIDTVITVEPNDVYLELPEISNGRNDTLLLPDPATCAGKELTFINTNITTYEFVFKTPIRGFDGSEMPTLPNGNTIRIISNGVVWRRVQ